MNSKQSVHASLLVFLCFLGSAAGSYVGLSVRLQPSPTQQAPPPLPEPDLTPLLGELVTEVRALHEELAAPKDARTSAPLPLEAKASETPSLLERLSTLVGALESQHTSLVSAISLAEIARAPPARAKVSLLPEAMPGHELPEGFDAMARFEALSKQHRLWSVREVVTAYGMPDEVFGGDRGLRLTYLLEESGYRINFYFSEGVVTHVNF